MEMLKYFFTAYLNQSFGFDYLDSLIDAFKTSEISETQLEFITELHQIIQTRNYAFAGKTLDKTGLWSFKNDLLFLEKLFHHIYNRLIERPRKVKGVNFVKHLHHILCPSCSPTEKRWGLYNVIEKATITKNNMVVYICKPCSLIWLTNDISLEKAQDYKDYMKSVGLPRFWNELQDREIYRK